MRHRKRGRKLSRTSAHRKATRQNLAKALFEHERIVTTPEKAKEVKSFVEKLITLARKAQPYKNSEASEDRARYVHYYRLAMRKLQDKRMVQKLFGEGQWHEGGSLAERYAERPSGQTRIIRLAGSRLGTALGYTVEDITEIDYQLAGRDRKLKLTGNRLGDNARQVIFELVRQNEQEPEGEEVAPDILVSDAEGTVEESLELQAETPGASDEQSPLESDDPGEETETQAAAPAPGESAESPETESDAGPDEAVEDDNSADEKKD